MKINKFKIARIPLPKYRYGKLKLNKIELLTLQLAVVNKEVNHNDISIIDERGTIYK